MGKLRAKGTTYNEEGPCPYVKPLTGHVDSESSDTCGFNEMRYRILTTHAEDGSPKLVECRGCGQHIENT